MNPQPSAAAPRGPTSGVHRAISTPKPLLASEVLREELAPLEPSRTKCRIWLGGVCIALALLGAALRYGVGTPALRSDASTLAFSAAGAAAAVALLPFPYGLRAAVAFLLGATLMALGLRGQGPLAGLGNHGARLDDIARLLPLTVLTSALLFRGRYRAYRTARILLAIALFLTLPFIALEIIAIANPGTTLIARLAAAASVAAVLCALFGFMGAGTTGAGSVWAALVLAVLVVEVALRELPSTSGALVHASAAVGLACGAVLTTLGLFQLLATLFARDARNVAAVTRSEPLSGR